MERGFRVKAELEDGSIVELEKECDCVTHDEPHWIHENDLTKKLLRKDYGWALDAIKESSTNFIHYYAVLNAIHCYAEEEAERCGGLIKQMERRKIVRLIR